jgi:hypothetical protein
MAAEDWISAPEPGSGTWADTAKGAFQTVDDAVRAAANAVTFGMADRFAGYMGGEGTDAEQAKSNVARARSPVASIVGDVGGAVALPGFGAEALAARTAPRLGGLGSRIFGYGTTGAATGAAQGAGNTYTGELPDYIKNAGLGLAMGGILGGVGGAAFGRGPAVSRAETPTAPQLWAEKNVNYGDLARSQAAYEPQALAQHADDLEARLLNERFHWRDSPRTWQALEEMRGAPAPGQLGTGTNAIVDPANIDFIRKGINKIPFGEASATDRASGRIVKNALDDFLVNPPPGAVLPGTERAAADAAALAERARGNYAGLKRVNKMEDFIANAENQAGATHSGLNLQNELRKQVKPFVRLKDGTTQAAQRGFNPDEITALTNYVRGTNPANVLRWAGNTLGGGGGIAGPIAGGVAVGAAGKYFKDDPEMGAALGVGVPATGLLLRAIGNRRANTDLQQLRNMIAQRTPLYQERTAMAGMRPGPGSPFAATSTRNAVALELMKQTQPQQVGNTTDWQ